MRHIHILGKSQEKVEAMKGIVLEKGFEIVEENPDIVICYGGDGMFLISERIFPGVPKISVRDSDVGNMTHDLKIEEILDKYTSKDFIIEDIRKLKAVRRGRFEVRELIGVNDIVLRNSLPTEAIRFKYRINEGNWSEVLIGDGIVVSTSYGSNKGAYFYSIAQEKFEKGIGVAFNNITEYCNPIYLDEGGIIEIEIVRGIGVLVSDNNRDYVNLETGDTIMIRMIEEKAKRVVLK